MHRFETTFDDSVEFTLDMATGFVCSERMVSR
jgi:hypothetical protein